MEKVEALTIVAGGSEVEEGGCVHDLSGTEDGWAVLTPDRDHRRLSPGIDINTKETQR